MAIEISPSHFSGRDQAMARIAADGLFFAEATIRPEDFLPNAHVHPYRVDIYVLGGMLELHEPDTGLTHRLEPGTRAIVPANTLHAEYSPAGLHAAFGVSEDPAAILAARAAG